MRDYNHYINGEMVQGSGAMMTVCSPVDGTVCGRYNGAQEQEAVSALQAAKEAFPVWSKLTLKQRTEWIDMLGAAIKEKRELLIDTLILETGKPYEGAAYDCDMLLYCFDYFPSAARNLHGEIIEDENDEMLNIIIRKPLGVVVGYLAWNYPLLNVAYKLGPALSAGCTVVIKPSKETPLATMLLGELMKEINFPKGVVNIISGSSSKIGPVLSGSNIPSMITMIGSTSGGLQVIKESATSIKKFSLELGGNAPVFVMEDADLSAASSEIIGLKFGNCGQTCVAPNRVFVNDSVYDEFLQLVKEKTTALKLGWGKMQDAWTGPMINRSDRDKMLELIKEAVSKGAKVLCGGDIPENMPEGGNWITPCVLYDVTPNMRVYSEEIFGPVLPIILLNKGDDAALLGNDTEYGLAAYVFTQNVKTALKLSKELDFGTVCVNKPYYSVCLPHGGCKQSGLGKDCSTYSLEEYYTVQRISIAQ